MLWDGLKSLWKRLKEQSIECVKLMHVLPLLPIFEAVHVSSSDPLWPNAALSWLLSFFLLSIHWSIVLSLSSVFLSFSCPPSIACLSPSLLNPAVLQRILPTISDTSSARRRIHSSCFHRPGLVQMYLWKKKNRQALATEAMNSPSFASIDGTLCKIVSRLARI